MKNIIATLALVLTTSQFAVGTTNINIDSGLGAVAQVAGGIADTLLLPITAMVSCMNERLEVCRPAAAFVRLSCKQSLHDHYMQSGFEKTSVSQSLEVSYLDHDRNSKVLNDETIWNIRKYGKLYSTNDVNYDSSEVNILADQLDLQCRQMINNLTKKQAEGYKIGTPMEQ